MRNILFALASTFVIATSYISSDRVAVSANPKADTLAAPVKFASEPLAVKSFSKSETLYNDIDFSGINKLNYSVFEKALKGFENLKKAGKISPETKLLTICDFSLSSNSKRLWVIDTESGKILYNSLVAHGKNTGEEFAEHFSNTENSLQSSLGFYITNETYEGENGYSLKLEGMDKGFNDNALQRSIVMHGADYVSEDFAQREKRIGRSWGCPALPRELAEPIINTIKNETVLFIYAPDQSYLNSSKWLKSS